MQYPPIKTPVVTPGNVKEPAAEGEFLRQGVFFEGQRLAQRVNGAIPDQLDPKKLTETDVKPLIQAAAAVQA